MHNILEINQVKAIIIKHLNKKIIDDDNMFDDDNMLELCLYHKFHYNDDNILYAKVDKKYIYFYNFLNDINVGIHHYFYEYLPNKYFIINIYLVYNNHISISINGKESDINKFEFIFNDLNSNIMNYINSIKLLYKL